MLAEALRNLKQTPALALLCLLAAANVAAGQNAPPPLVVKVQAAAGDVYKSRVKSSTQQQPPRDEELVLIGSNDTSIEFKLTATCNRDCTIHVEGIVTDFYGTEVTSAKLNSDIAAKPGKPIVTAHTLKPTPLHVGPFTLKGSWNVPQSDAKGDFSVTLGLPNVRVMIDDFEDAKHKQAGAELENASSAARHGKMGLIVRIPKADAPTQRVPLNAALPGRPVKISLWMKSAAQFRVQASVRDASKKDDFSWLVGPQVIEAGDWRLVELPLPLSAPSSITYPLTLTDLLISGTPGQTVFVDALELSTQRDLVATVAPAQEFPRMAVSYSGWRIHQGGTLESINNRKSEACLFPAAGKPLAITLSASAFGSEKRIHFDGNVRDYFGTELTKVSFDVTAKPRERVTHTVSINPTENHFGPFYLNGAWSEVNGTLREDVALVLAQANWRLVIEDFEQVQHPEPGALENSPTAKHRGEMGLIVQTNGKKQAVPLNLSLAARPVKIGMWVKTPAPVQASMRVRDPGVNHMGGMRYDTWTVGPVEISAGDWQYVELPMPDYSPPKALRKSYAEANGIVDYPLTLEELEFTGPEKNAVFVDDIELWAQGEQTGSVSVRAASSKPSSLLYKNDSVNLVISNAWLWGQPQTISYSAALVDVTQRSWPLSANQTVTVPPGTEVVKACATQLPLGPYNVIAEASVSGKIVAKIPAPKVGEEPSADPSFLVYEPTGKPLSHRELHTILRDRNRLIAEMGFTRDNRLFTWHSTQNTPAMENYTGYFYFDWLRPDVKARRDAGLEVLGTLGFTPQFYDPSARFITNYTEWFGSTVAMPSRSIYFEEYAHRTIENFASQVSTWIVWERPDAPGFASPEEYTDKMLEVARRAATEANPNAKLISGAITRENMETYLTGMIEAGAHRFVDGIGILPSPAPLSPEDGYLDIILARAQRLRKQEQVKPELWVLNLGWSSGDGPERVSEFNQAVYIPRAYILCRAAGIENILIQPDGTEATAKRDSADLIFPQGNLLCLKPAALSVKNVQLQLKDAKFIRELFLDDRSTGLARAYLFSRPDGKLLLTVWRCEGSSTLRLSQRPEQIFDAFGNQIPQGSEPTLTLRPSPQYIVFPAGDSAALARSIERGALTYDDTPESAWKRQFTFHLNVGNAEEEKAANYEATQSRLVGPVESSYHTDYGRHVTDTGRHFKGEEKFVVDVSAYGNADLLLRKRINYSLLNQLVKVYCNGQFVGQWAAPKRDLRYRWRDIEYVIPNSFFAGKNSAELRFIAQGNSEASSYYYWAGPLKTKTIYLSDLSLLYGTAGGAGPMVSLDKNVLGAPMKFFKKPQASFAKGIGTNAGARFEESLVVLSLNKQFKRLRGTVGIDACTNGRGTVRFSIGGLTKTLWQSPDMTYYSEPKEFDIDVSNEIILTLSVSDSGDGPKDDIANWAGLQLELK
ncbi:MAG TPA: NPCBM/NEW2 domain-containing protein [Planctomycetota bacterium]|nr:NPCBM/NEW2 domain-containing protein [Planctomycetota bacterium]